MRTLLKERSGKRGKFSATVERFGQKTSYGYTKDTLLLRDVHDQAGERVTDHLWFNVGKQVQELSLQPGDRIEFTATVRPYQKGYRGRREGDDLPAPSIDYGLKFPRGFRKIHHDFMGRILKSVGIEVLPSIATTNFPQIEMFKVGKD